MDNFGGFLKLTKYEIKSLSVFSVFLLILLVIKFSYFEGKVENEKIEDNISEVITEPKIYKNSVKQKKIKSTSLISKENKTEVTVSDQNTNFFSDTLIDINNISEDILVRIGFSSKKSKTIINYKNSINGFNNKTQFGKIYLLNDSEVDFLKNHTVIKIQTINLNKASEEELRKVRGIGKVLSGRIVKYRDLLGGYYNINQLMEVYGVKKDDFLTIKNYFYIDTSDVDMILLPIATLDDLISHPYISEYLSKKIINEKSKGELKSLQDLREIINDEVLFQKIRYYVKF